MKTTCQYTEASISSDGAYRYHLVRGWGDLRSRVCWVMLNPSTADEVDDDPTIRRCIAFSKAWGYGSLVVVNLFALRATDPAQLRNVAHPVGPLNDEAIRKHSTGAGLVVAAWGHHGGLYGRDRLVRKTLPADARHLGLTKDGHPKHPLYISGNTQPKVWGLA